MKSIKYYGLIFICCLTAAMAGGLHVYEVHTGETLDQVIKKTMPNSPLSMTVLRQAFIEQNPQAFTKTTPRVLMAGAKLVVPDQYVLMQRFVGDKETTKMEDSDLQHNEDERRSWIRFP